MGLFSRKKKIDQRPVPGRDDLVAISEDDLYEFALSLVQTIVGRVEEEIPEQVSMLFGFGTMSMNRAMGWDVDEIGQSLSQTAARYGYFVREVEASESAGALKPEEAGILLRLYEKQEIPPGQPGFIRSMNTASELSFLPTESELELDQYLDFAIPGWGTAVREMIGRILVWNSPVSPDTVCLSG